MKLTFYIYWAWYCTALILFLNITMTLEQAKFFTCVHHLSQILLVVVPMAHLLIMREKMDKVDWKYFEGCTISFVLRGMGFIFGVYGVTDRFIILALSGVVIGLWFLFNVDKLLEKI